MKEPTVRSFQFTVSLPWEFFHPIWVMEAKLNVWGAQNYSNKATPLKSILNHLLQLDQVLPWEVFLPINSASNLGEGYQHCILHTHFLLKNLKWRIIFRIMSEKVNCVSIKTKYYPYLGRNLIVAGFNSLIMILNFFL